MLNSIPCISLLVITSVQVPYVVLNRVKMSMNNDESQSFKHAQFLRVTYMKLTCKLTYDIVLTLQIPYEMCTQIKTIVLKTIASILTTDLGQAQRK